MSKARRIAWAALPSTAAAGSYTIGITVENRACAVAAIEVLAP